MRRKRFLAAERLHAHDSADLVAVDVAIAHFCALCNMGYCGIDVRLWMPRCVRPKPRGVDLVDHRVQLAGLPAQHVQDRAENFVGQLCKLDCKAR